MTRVKVTFSSLLLSVFLGGFMAFIAPTLTFATPFPGPDAFGYVAVSTPFNLRNISSSGTFVSLGDDQVSGAIPLPFTFKFYGVDYNQVFISSNGFITFDAASSQGCCSGQPLPQVDAVNNVIAGFWEDLNLPQGNIRYQTLGTTPNREFVVGFYNVPHYFSGPQVTFEIILHEGSKNIELQYGSAPSDGGQHSAGIENSDGTIGLQIAFGNVSFNNEGFLISSHIDASIASVDDSSCPINAQMTISDAQGHALSGEVNILEPHNPFPNGLSEIRLELLHTRCGGTPTFNFSLGSTLVDSFLETVPQTGQPAPDPCSCTPGIETRVYDNPGILALWNPADGASNQFQIDRSTTCCDTALAWARVVLSGPSQPTRTYCVFDQGGGDCNVTNLCAAGYTFDSVQANRVIEDDFVVGLSESYANSTLPSCVDLSSLQSPVIAIELVTTDGTFTTTDRVDNVNRGACTFLSINNAPCNNQPPVCTGATASPSTLWPPNHQLVPISITGVTDPDGDAVSITATSITQDEAVRETGVGSGNTAPDATLSPLAVRVERNGNPKSPGNGRVYHIDFTADDGKGGQCTGAVTVCVPHDQRPGATCVDGGPLYNSLAP